MTTNEIMQKINELKSRKENCLGTKCEVYSRVVGYLRPVSLWNEGKKEEFKIRKTFNIAK